MLQPSSSRFLGGLAGVQLCQIRNLFVNFLAGIMFGSFVVRRFPVKKVGKRSALYVAVSHIFTIIAPLAFLIPGCLNVNMAGVSTVYADRTNSTHVQAIGSYSNDMLLSRCNLNCSCSVDKFAPVCGSDNLVYANPCYAGCSVKHDNKTFGSCSCISTGSDKPDMAIQGYCDRNCKNMALFLFAIGVTMFLRFTSSVPLQTVVLRCVPDNKRAFAMGMQYLFLKAIGLIPGPIIFGHLLDISCKLWQDICGEKGRCFDYDIDSVDRNICIFGAVATGVSAVFYLFSWLLYQQNETRGSSVVENKNTDGTFETMTSVM